MFRYELITVDQETAARRGAFHTPRGAVQTPAFMPVGTQGTVKGLSVDQVRATGAEMILANTYHLALRPGEDVVAALGDLHGFTGWEGPILTDSGGFQVFSLARIVRVDDEGAVFRAHTDGRLFELTPERAVEIQRKLGSDVAMVLDHVISLPSSMEAVEDACRRTIRWARRARDAHVASPMVEADWTSVEQAQFAIVQGGLSAELRQWCCEQLVAMDFPGYAVGGLSVGEPASEMYRVLDATCPHLPGNRPRYLMGVGSPEDLLESIARGVDLFDCVLPTRNGRNALAFTAAGKLRLRNRIHQSDGRPLEEDCPCLACRHSRGYLRHLFQSGEMLGPILLSQHNLTYYQRLVAQARDAIEQRRFASFHDSQRERWRIGEG